MKHIAKSIIVVFILAAFLIQSVMAQSLSELDDIARATTVLIAPDLTAPQVATGQERTEAGSGVLIARQTDVKEALRAPGSAGGPLQHYKYWVLTNAHVVDIDDEGVVYGIRTADGEVYPEGNSSITQKSGIYRFDQDCPSGTANSCNAGTDLAVLTFYSNKIYPVAAIGDPSKIAPGEVVQASGWPATVSRNNSKRIRFPANGEIRRILPVEQRLDGNYSLETTIRFKQGASGGPVFNINGELIGIYGKGQAENEQIGSSRNYAIDIGQFLTLLTSPKYKQVFEFAPSLLAVPTKRDPITVSFGRKYQDIGDNMTAEERRKFAFVDILDDDPRKASITRLRDEYGCWRNYEGNYTGAGLTERRGEFVNDIYACMSSLEKRISAAAADFVKPEELKEFQSKVEALAGRVQKLKSSGVSVPNRPQQLDSVQSSTSSRSNELIPASLISFDFRSPGPYSYCLEDIIQLHLDVENFRQRGRRGTCLPEIFTRYQSRGLTRDQAHQLIEAANTYATSAFTGVKMYPPSGQRIRIAELFGIRYELDKEKR